MSRWTRPFACAASSAEATCETTSTASSGSKPPLAVQKASQVGALDEVHRHEQEPVLLARVMDGDHIRVADRDRDPRLRLEALAEGLVSRARARDQLQRDDVVEREVPRAIDHAESAAPRDPLDPVAGELAPGTKFGHRPGLFRDRTLHPEQA